MKTYLVVWFHSEGSEPQRVVDRLTSFGFKPMQGAYDFVYSWPQKPDVDELIAFADKVHNTLKGLDVLFKLESM